LSSDGDSLQFQTRQEKASISHLNVVVRSFALVIFRMWAKMEEQIFKGLNPLFSLNCLECKKLHLYSMQMALIMILYGVISMTKVTE